MTDVRFPILGPAVPPMVGRAAAMDRTWKALTKMSPSHLSVVGPRHAGKSVFLKALAERVRADGEHYTGTIFWDLGHLTPSSDAEFISTLSRKIVDELRRVDAHRFADYATYIEEEGYGYGGLKEAVEQLKSEGVRLLLLLDGFDRPLAADTLTRNLWDQLRELASLPNLRIVTTSRERLRELIRNAAAAGSDFWNIFDPTPLALGAMGDVDVQDALSRCAFGKLGPGAEAEIANWTGRFPPLLLGLLNAIEADGHVGPLTRERVNAGATAASADLQDVLAEMWEGCSEATKDLYRELVEAGARSVEGLGWDQRERLIALGMATEAGGRLRKGCRMLEEFIRVRYADQGSVARLFRSPDGYRANIASILELRLQQVQRINPELRRVVERSIQDLPEYAGQALINLRNFAERSFTLIWNAEFGAGRRISAQVVGQWRERGVRGVEDFERLEIPGEIRRQARLLQLLVGAEQNVNRQARHVSRQTFQLVSAVVGFGNYGQHMEGEEVGLGTAVAAVIVALELAVRLSEELPLAP